MTPRGVQGPEGGGRIKGVVIKKTWWDDFTLIKLENVSLAAFIFYPKK